MAAISATLVKELREMTGAGMMDCKKALTKSDGDLEGAKDWLRKKGLSMAAKKAGRVAAEGLVGVALDGRRGAIVEVNSETDFVARNEAFQIFVKDCAQLALDCGDDLEALKAAAHPSGEGSLETVLTNLVAKIGENMSIRRARALSVDEGVVSAYIHNKATPELGKIGVVVALSSSADPGPLADLGKQLAMHIANTDPAFVDRSSVTEDALDKEREFLAEQARASGKPEEIIEKMVEGRLRKYYEEVCLLEQVFVIDGESKVADVIAKAGKDLGAEITVAGFARFKLGEGIEKKEDDFAAEVAAAVGQP
jgi:elongation factor Ts